MSVDLSAVPTTEIGTPGLVGSRWLETWEDTKELVWPASTVAFDKMRRSDGKLSAVRQSYRRPIVKAASPAHGCRLDGDGCDPGVVANVAANFGLPLPGEARVRRHRAGINLRELVSHALLALDFGHMPMETVYTVGKPLDGVPVTRRLGNGLGEVANLRKLAPRMPRSLTEIVVDADGGLAGVGQDVPRIDPQTGRTTGQYDRRIIPVDRLLYFINEREGAEWAGQSIHRAAYKHWLIRDALLRLGPQIVERNGMGVPVVTYPEGADRALALEIAKGFRAGDEAGIALPAGWALDLVGVNKGSTRDELPLVKYHDEAMGKSSLTLFLDLGHDAGARSLGDTFLDVFGLALAGCAEDIADTITDYAIRDFVELNYGEGEPYPRLVFGDLMERPELAPEGLKTLVDAGLIAADEPMRKYVRARHGLPAAPTNDDGTPAVDPAEDVASSPFASVGLPALVQAGIISADEARVVLGKPGPAPAPPATAMRAALAGRPEGVAEVRLLLGLSPQDAPAYGDPLVARLASLNERLLKLHGGAA